MRFGHIRPFPAIQLLSSFVSPLNTSTIAYTAQILLDMWPSLEGGLSTRGHALKEKWLLFS